MMFLPHDLCYVYWDPMDYKIMFRLSLIFIMVSFDIDVELCFFNILLMSYLRLFLRVIAVSLLHSITLAMWFGVTPVRSSLARWLGSCLLMTSLSDRNISLVNVP